jgi:Xaa-Pro aminopeptidase
MTERDSAAHDGAVNGGVFTDRRRRAADLLEKKGLGGYFFSGPADLYYLTGFSSEGFHGLVTGAGTWIYSSALLAQQIRESTSGVTVVVGKKLGPALREMRTRLRIKKIGFDPEQTLYGMGRRLVEKAGLTPSPNPLSELRAVKDAGELELLRRAGRITAETVRWAVRHVRAGMTEIQMARMIRDRFERLGAADIGFELIAAVGPHTALPHHHPTETALKKDQAVLFDVGCRVGAYRSDLTRTFFYGSMPPSFRRVFRIVETAQKAGFAAVEPGKRGKDVDAASRGVIKKAGYGRYFVHSTGHGVGVDIHEPPWIRDKSPDLLKPDMVLTVEPGIYLPGRFGVRIEDTLRVTPEGFEILTKGRNE